jgi:hypothetical protein
LVDLAVKPTYTKRPRCAVLLIKERALAHGGAIDW